MGKMWMGGRIGMALAVMMAVPAAVRAQELTAFATASVDGDESNIQLVGASLLLASDAGGFITGSEIVVDGGFAAMSI